MPLIKLFLDIALLNRGPRDVPASGLLLALVVTADLIVGVGVGLSLLETEGADALIQSMTSLSLLAGFLGGALWITGKLPRLLQTATAAFGCDALISAAAVPLLVGMQWAPEVRDAISLLLMLLMLWQQVVVNGHILRQALSIPLLAGLGLSLVYTVASYEIMMTLFPAGT